MSDAEYESKGIIAERLDQLFAAVQPKGRPFTLKEVAEGINANAGEPLVSVQYLSQLRKGDRREPSRKVLGAIAAWFGVRDYFFSDGAAGRTDEELWVLNRMKETGVRDVFFRTDGVSQQSLELVKAMLDTIRAAEGLPPVSADDQPGSAEG